MSPRNAGLRTFPKEIVGEDGQRTVRNEIIGEGKWEPIVDREIWQGVMDILANPSRRFGQSRARKHLLSNIAKCGVCGSGMGSGVNKSGKLIYTCRSCNANSRNGAWLDALAIEAVAERLSDPAAVELLIPEERDDTNELRERARALRARLDSLAVEFADGVLSPAQIKTATKRINAQLEGIESALRDGQRTHVFDGLIGPGLEARDVAEVFNNLDLDRQRAVIDAAVQITVKPTGRCGRVFRREDVDVVIRQA